MSGNQKYTDLEKKSWCANCRGGRHGEKWCKKKHVVSRTGKICTHDCEAKK